MVKQKPPTSLVDIPAIQRQLEKLLAKKKKPRAPRKLDPSIAETGGWWIFGPKNEKVEPASPEEFLNMAYPNDKQLVRDLKTAITNVRGAKKKTSTKTNSNSDIGSYSNSNSNTNPYANLTEVERRKLGIV